jgi:toxin CcdB
MPQFSVHKNKNPKTRATYPYLVAVQSDLLSGLNTRVVVPLVRHTAVGRKPIRDLTPVVSVEGQSFVMFIPQLAGIAANELGPAVAMLSAHRNEIVAAMDFLITGI